MKNILLFVFSFLLTSFYLDAFLKYTRITPPTLKYYDPVYGSLNRPNIEYFKATEGLYIGNTNYEGRFRESYSKKKDDKKTLRILLMGDSFVEGIDVFSKNHFAQYTEDILKQKLNRDVQVMNFGRGNCTIGASSYYFNNYVSKEYDGDIVLYFTEGRDIYYDGPNAGGYPSTHYSLDEHENLIPSYSWKKTSEYLLHKKLSENPILQYYDLSAYFRLTYRALARIKISGAATLTFDKFATFMKPKYEAHYSNWVYSDPVSEFSQKLYDTIYNYNKGHVIFVVRKKPGAAPAIIEYMKLKHYDYINLEDTFDDYTVKNTNIDAYYFKASNSYGGHWNNDGHHAVGYFMANNILRRLDTMRLPYYQK